MSHSFDRFSKNVVDNISRRSANICSNPDCCAITSGPAEDDDRSINVGEAAHIYGANPGSARYDCQMSSAERSAITNAIWLCRNCHKIIDADPNQYPSSLLFEWRKEHEDDVSKRIGKTGDRLRRKIIDAELESFSKTTYLARQIVIDRPIFWEYRLTAELLRHFLDPIMFRARALEFGLYVKSYNRVRRDDAAGWFQDRIGEIGSLCPAISSIANSEFSEAWGAPGVAGSPDHILRTCELFAEACQQLLLWEETVRFSSFPGEFNDLKGLFTGLGLRILNKIYIIPREISEIFNKDDVTGSHEISFQIDLPEYWSDRVENEIRKLSMTFGYNNLDE